VSAQEHDHVVRRSFEQQTGLFTGDDALFARRQISALAWLEPLDPGMIVLDVACGAATPPSRPHRTCARWWAST
jgi:ubiquinone/menaquinone biosynthesis C-methylase UbiE